MRLLQEHKTAVIIGVVGFVIWLLFHFATKKVAEKTTLATINPTAPPLY